MFPDKWGTRQINQSFSENLIFFGRIADLIMAKFSFFFSLLSLYIQIKKKKKKLQGGSAQ